MSKGKIFLVDDAEYDRMLINKYLTKSGYECTTYNNGPDLIKALEEISSATVLIDIEMPGMNGMEISNYIRKKLENSEKHFTLIGITGHCENHIVEEIALAGFDDCLHKPVSKTELISRISQYVQPVNTYSPAKQPLDHPYESLYTLDYFDPDDEEFLKSIIQMFLQNTPESIQQLKTAYINEDWTLLRNIAHKLKPHFQYFGIETVAKALQETEDIVVMQTGISHLPELLAKIEQTSCTALNQLKMKFSIPVS